LTICAEDALGGGTLFMDRETRDPIGKKGRGDHLSFVADHFRAIEAESDLSPRLGRIEHGMLVNSSHEGTPS
jgi:hypothetical protein